MRVPFQYVTNNVLARGSIVHADGNALASAIQQEVVTLSATSSVGWPNLSIRFARSTMKEYYSFAFKHFLIMFYRKM